METSRQSFFNAIKNFPRWMNIRKRPEKSTGGKLLQSIVEEQNNIVAAIDKYKSDFFLLSYVGREHEIMDYAYTLFIGKVDPEKVKLKDIKAEIIVAPKTFIEKPMQYVFYQSGYLFFHPSVITPDRKIMYVVDGYEYGGSAEKKHIWNIFDEFALFSELERFEDETNKELMHRCFAAFKNRTNSTEEGIKNTILNTVSNIIPISSDDITIEKVSQDNIFASDSNGDEIYEKLAAFNQDVFRTKKWDMDTWEHGFKALDYVPHVWDAPIEVYQDGTGQMNDLKVSLSSDVEDIEATNIFVTGYEASKISVDEYARKKNIKKEIPLVLEQYKNELKSKEANYKIIASEASKIDPKKVYIRSLEKIDGERKQYLSDIVVNAAAAKIVQRNLLDANKTYALKFFPLSDYSDMIIDKIEYAETNVAPKSLIVETNSFKKQNGSLHCADVLLHATKINDLKSSKGMIAHKNGITLAPSETEGSLCVDTTGMDGKFIKVKCDCEMENITLNNAFVKAEGFVETANRSWLASDTGNSSNIIIDLDCSEISFELAAAEIPSMQGSCTVLIQIDGSMDIPNSGVWSTPKVYSKKLEKFSHVHIEIIKAGMNPVEIQNITASRYDLTTKVESGELIHSSFGTMLPLLGGKKNSFCVNVKNYGTHTPVIRYVHVGSSLANTVYSIDNIKSGNGGSIDISTNCRVELYEIANGKNTLLSKDYVTKPLYENHSTDNIYMEIDTESFVAIKDSSKPIGHTTSNGNIVSYIILQPGESIDAINVTGIMYGACGRDSLYKLLECTDDDNVYVCKNSNGFIIQNQSTKDEKIVAISRNVFANNADSFSYEGLPSGMIGQYVIDKKNNNMAQNNHFDRNFEETYAILVKSEEYVAYNKTSVIKTPLLNVKVVNTFSPLLDTNRLMYYEIIGGAAAGYDAQVRFEKISGAKTTYDNWSLGLKDAGIRIDMNMEHSNSDSYGLDVGRLNETFSISNNIELSKTYPMNGEDVELAKFIITPPDDMVVMYTSENCGQKIIVENDGFNKLWYSNIQTIIAIMIDGVQISANKYTLLKTEGILVWNTDEYYGKNASIMYSYKVPKSLTYKNLNALYDLIGYSTDAYKAINTEPIVASGLKDGDSYKPDFGGKKPDKVIIHCSNSNFQASIDGDNIKVKKIAEENVAIMNTGYYYDDGDEYYLFNHVHEETIDRMSNVKLHNIKRRNNTFVFIQHSTNYLLDTSFRGRRKEALSYVNCKDNEHIDGISDMKALTSCDSYNMWQQFNMNVELRQSVNGLGINFTPTDKVAYAILDISRFAIPGHLLSLAASDGINTVIMEEELIDDMSMVKSIFARPMATMEKVNAYRKFIFKDTMNTNARHYLVVNGSGMIDDIIAKPYQELESQKDLHTKNIDALGFSVTEQIEKETMHHLNFDTNGNLLSGLDITQDGDVITGSNVDWGLTKIYDLKRNMEACTLHNVIEKHGALYAEDKLGRIRTEKIFLENYKAVNSIHVKINDVMIDEMTNFDVKVYTAKEENGTYREAASTDKTNLLQVFAGKLAPYLQIEVDMPSGRVITSIEIYAKYAEKEDPLYITPVQKGMLTTKIYDAAFLADYRPAFIDGKIADMKNVELYIRGCRYDSGHEAWTEWYPHEFDETLHFVSPHIFNKYQLFQFMIKLNSSAAKCSIKSFVFEVI